MSSSAARHGGCPWGDARFVGEETTGVRILVVEDDPVMNDLLVKVFEHEGFAAVGASGGHEVTVV